MSETNNPPGAAATTGGAVTTGSGAAAVTTQPTTAPPPAAFAEQLPEDIRGEAAFRDIRDLGSLAKGYLNAQKLIGLPPDRVLRLPDGDDPAAMEAVYARLGRPDKPDAYKFSNVKLPEGLALDDKLKGGYQAAAHAAGLSTKQADALYQWWNATMGETFTARGAETARALETTVGALKAEWGAAFDQNLALAKEAIGHYGGEKLKAELEGNGLGNSPELARIFAKLGRNLQEDGLLQRGSGGGAGIASPGEARQQISALQQDQAFSRAYMNKSDPGHADAVAKMARLYEQAYPTAA